MRQPEQSHDFQEKPYDQPHQRLQWFVFPCNVIPFRYDPEQGCWLYVHVMQLVDDKRVDALHAIAEDGNMGTLSLGYPRTAAHDLDRLDEWVYIRAPLDRYVDLTTYAQGLDRPSPDEQRRLQESYRVFVQTLNFEGMPYRDKRYLLAKHRQFQKRLAQGYYEGLH